MGIHGGATIEDPSHRDRPAKRILTFQASLNGLFLVSFQFESEGKWKSGDSLQGPLSRIFARGSFQFNRMHYFSCEGNSW